MALHRTRQGDAECFRHFSLRPKAGRIVFDDVDTTKLDSSATYELGIGQVAEGRQIFPSLTVEENLVLGGTLSMIAASTLREATNAAQPIIRTVGTNSTLG